MLCLVLDWSVEASQHVAQSINRLHNCIRNDSSTATKWADQGKFNFVVYNAIMMPLS
jgi:hypothetical protein